jgi:integrase
LSIGETQAPKAAYAKIVNEISERRFVARDGIAVSEYLDRWEPAHGRDLEEGSRAVIRYSLQRVRERLGSRALQSITRADVDGLVDWMSTKARKRGGKPGTGLSARSVQQTLVAFSRACDDAVDERLMNINPCRRVKRPKQVKPEHELWTNEESARFEKVAAADRLAPVIVLQCLGLRPEEVCGLRWRDVDLKAGTLRGRLARTLVDGKPVEKPPKTAAGKRVLPLDDALVSALKAFKGRLAA